MQRFVHIAFAGLVGLAASWSLAGGPSTAQVARQLDRLVVDDVGLEPAALAPLVGDAAFLRRAHLDLVGSIPTVEELRAFIDDDAPDKRRSAIRALLARPEFGLTQARYWRDVVLSRRLEDRALLAGPAMVEDLGAWFNEDRPWDEVAGEFLTATGSVRENGATAIVMAQDGRTEDVAAEASRVFLGVQIQCAQCHDHPWDNWKREQFHQLAAYFPRVGVRPTLMAKPPEFAVVVNDRPDRPRFRKKENANRRGSPEHYMDDLNDPAAEGTRTSPKFFLTGASLPIGTPDAERRASLAEEFARSEWFSIALTNRLWGELVGEAFYEPVDDLGPGRTASAPRAAKRLAGAFVASGYDVKWLFETVMLTEAYQREARPRREPHEKPFAASVAQPLRGDQQFGAMLAALQIDEASLARFGTPGAPGRPGLVTPRMVFNTAFGYDPSLPRETIKASIPQALARMNTPQINRAVSAGQRTMLGRLLAEHPGDSRESNHAVARDLYLGVLSREP
ncbi:MAG: DUF1549 domain-containing protein, partial [Lacipirellulaceae bacterium]